MKHTLKFLSGCWYLDGVAYNNINAALCRLGDVK